MPIHGLPFSDEKLFALVDIVMPGWVLLALFPRWRYTQTIAAAAALLSSALYTALLVTLLAFPPDGPKLDYSEMFSYEGVVRTLSNGTLVLPCWVHYAAFDLWVGRWMASDAVQRGVPQLLLIPCLFVTLFSGPTGLLLYFLIRTPFNKAPASGSTRQKTKAT